MGGRLGRSPFDGCSGKRLNIHAIEGLTDSLVLQLDPLGVQFSAVEPGLSPIRNAAIWPFRATPGTG
jgi:hypothetical protein